MRNNKNSDIFPINQLKNSGSFCINGISHFRFVDKDSIFYCITRAYFEIVCVVLSVPKEIPLSKRVKCVKKFGRFKTVQDGILKFLTYPKFQVLEILKNNFDCFNEYMKILFEYYVKKHGFEKLGISLEEMRVCPDFLKIMGKLTGLEIEIYSKDSELLVHAPEKLMNKDHKIRLLKLNKDMFCILYTDLIETQIKAYISTKNINSSYDCVNTYQNNEGVCLICFHLSDTKLKCGHDYHIKCIQKKQLSSCLSCKSPIHLTCTLCNATREVVSSTCKSCSYCQHCLVTLCYSFQDNSFSCHCNRPLDLFSLIITCISCKHPRYLLDFIPVLCFDRHDFLCKLCWTTYLQKIEQRSSTSFKNRFCCPLNNSPIGYLRDVLEKILKINCKICRNHSLQYYSEFLCPNNCEVCFECQQRANKKSLNYFTCTHCDTLLVKKSA